MKVYDDILTYYPKKALKNANPQEDFAIIRIEDVAKYVTENDKDKYREIHLRSFFEISIGLADSKMEKTNSVDNNASAKYGHLLFVSSEQPFSKSFNSRHDDHSKGFIIAFKPSFMVREMGSYEVIKTFRYFHSYTSPQFIMDRASLQSIVDIATKIFQENSNRKAFSSDIVRGYLEVLLYNFNRLLEHQAEQPSASACESVCKLFEKHIIEDNYEIGTIEYYASKINISTTYLNRCVKKTTGKNAKQVLLDHKLIVAKSMLQQHDKSISDIATTMGFSEQTNFSKFFRQMTGLTPNKFRALNCG